MSYPSLPSESVRILAEAPIPTRHGSFRFLVFQSVDNTKKEHVALVLGDPRGDNALVRVHSECMIAEVFGSLTCDCGVQLDRALERIARERSGVLVYMRQGGRGIGLVNERHSYAAAAGILQSLGVASVRLLSNNPEKVRALRALGVQVTSRLPLVSEERVEQAVAAEA